MRHLHLVPDLEPIVEDDIGPFDVVITNDHPRCADVTYKNIIHTHYEISSDYPHGVLLMTYESGDEVVHECLVGDCVDSEHITVEVH